MVGHSLAFFLVENLLAVLGDLIKLESESVEILLSRLQQEEDELYEDHIVKGDFQDFPKELYSFDSDSSEKIDLDASIFFKGKSMCHTARLPAQTRYLGYLTNSDKVGGPVPFGKETVSTDDNYYYHYTWDLCLREV